MSSSTSTCVVECGGSSSVEKNLREEITMKTLNEVRDMMSSKSHLKSPKRARNIAKAVSYSDIQIDSILGPGGFSMVYKVDVVSPSNPLYNGDDDESDSGSGYALKCVHNKIQASTKGVKAYRNAIYDIAMEGQLLSKLHHPNIIQLYGIGGGSSVLENDENDETENGSIISSNTNNNPLGYFLLLEVLHDTLSDKLKCWRDEQKVESIEAMKLITNKSAMNERIENVAIGIAKGLQYLHENNVILRDLKPDNIGFDAAGNPKLFDFGFAREVHTITDKTEIAGSLRYMSPENALGQGKGNLPAGDVYAFGVLLFELCTLQKPFQGFSRNKETFTNAVIKAGWRHSVVSIPSPTLQRLITQCWDVDVKVRPTIDVVVKTLSLEVSNSSGLTSKGSWVKSKKKLLIRSCGHLKALRSYDSIFKGVRSSFGSLSRTSKGTAATTTEFSMSTNGSYFESNNKNVGWDNIPPQTENNHSSLHVIKERLGVCPK